MLDTVKEIRTKAFDELREELQREAWQKNAPESHMIQVDNAVARLKTKLLDHRYKKYVQRYQD